MIHEAEWRANEQGLPQRHSGPGGCRINLSKCTKNAAKCGNVTLTIAYHENEINLYGSFKKNDFQSKNIFDLVNGDFGQSGP